MAERNLRPSIDVTIGERVHTTVWRQKLSQKSVAESLHLDASTLSKKLRGHRPWYAHEIHAISDLCGVSIAYLYGEREEPGPPSDDPGSQCAPGDLNSEPADIGSRRRVRHLVAA